MINENNHNSSRPGARRQGRTGMRLASLLLMLAAVITPAMSDDTPAEEASEYDKYFREFSIRYFGNRVDWRLFKAQGMVESRLTHDAKSHAGARGVMQVMPVTFREIQKKNPLINTGTIHSVATNINAGVYYNYYMYQRWETEVSSDMHIKLMLASYNAGFSRVLKAFNKAGAPENDWMAVAHNLPNETRTYVKRVLGKYQSLKATMHKPATSDIFLTKADTQAVVLTRDSVSSDTVPASGDSDVWRTATRLD